MMSTTPAPSGLQRFLTGLVDLVRFHQGTAAFEIDAAGDLVHTGTVVTVKMHAGESIEAFHARFRRDYDLRPGDRVEVLNNRGTCDTVRLTLQPR